jgi:hypothetical protein
MGVRYVRQEPHINDYGIFVPTKPCVPEGCACEYNCLITKEMFIEAYNKWIKNDNPFYGEDDADCWSED